MRNRNIFLIIAVVLFSTLLLYLPFLTKTLPYLGFSNNGGMNIVYQNYDGLYYVVPAMTGYLPKAIESLGLEFTLPLEYYAAHLPLYPFFISIFAPFVGGFLHSMIFVNIFFTALLAILFYFLISKFEISKKPLILTVVFLFLPRFLIIRSVGSPESLFIFLILASMYFFETKKYLLSGLFGFFAVVTKIPGILLFVAYFLILGYGFIKTKKFDWKYLYLLLIPAGLFAVFGLYAVQYENFWAYFNTGGVVPMPYIFSVFNSSGRWVNTVWLEDVLIYFAIYTYSVVLLKDIKYKSIFVFPLLFLFAGMFVQHRDLSRYLLPVWPFACIALEKTLTSKKFVLVLIFLLPAIYLYAWNFMQGNITPVSDWRPFI